MKDPPLFRFQFWKSGHFTFIHVFCNNECCGALTMRDDEWAALQERLAFGSSNDGAQIECAPKDRSDH